jgi:hypothetical protein
LKTLHVTEGKHTAQDGLVIGEGHAIVDLFGSATGILFGEAICYAGDTAEFTGKGDNRATVTA